MTLIELLELLVKGRPLSAKQREDALALLAELRRINAFGTVAATMHSTHECIPRLVEPARRRAYLACSICGRKL